MACIAAYCSPSTTLLDAILAHAPHHPCLKSGQASLAWAERRRLAQSFLATDLIGEAKCGQPPCTCYFVMPAKVQSGPFPMERKPGPSEPESRQLVPRLIVPTLSCNHCWIRSASFLESYHGTSHKACLTIALSRRTHSPQRSQGAFRQKASLQFAPLVCATSIHFLLVSFSRPAFLIRFLFVFFTPVVPHIARRSLTGLLVPTPGPTAGVHPLQSPHGQPLFLIFLSCGQKSSCGGCVCIPGALPHNEPLPSHVSSTSGSEGGGCHLRAIRALHSGGSIDLFLDAGVPLPRTHIYFSEGR